MGIPCPVPLGTALNRGRAQRDYQQPLSIQQVHLDTTLPLVFFVCLAEIVILHMAPASHPTEKPGRFPSAWPGCTRIPLYLSSTAAGRGRNRRPARRACRRAPLRLSAAASPFVLLQTQEEEGAALLCLSSRFDSTCVATVTPGLTMDAAPVCLGCHGWLPCCRHRPLHGAIRVSATIVLQFAATPCREA